MAQTLGIIDIVWRGRRIAVEKGAKFKPGGVKNNVVVAGRQVHRAEEFVAGEVTATTTLERGQRFLDLVATGSGELQVLCDTGQTLVWPDAFLQEIPEATGGEGGKIPMNWAVGVPQELING